MLILITLILSLIFCSLCAGAIKKSPLAFYIVGTAFSVALIYINLAHITGIPIFVSDWITPIFTKGILAAVLWMIVAGIAAFPNDSVLIKRLMPIRGELSIFSAIITMSHAVTYGVAYIRKLSIGKTDSEFILSFVTCMLLMVIMIPLTIISFKSIRKKMNAKKWKKIQKFAYIFYALIYLHIFIIYLQKRITTADLFNMIIYSAIFWGYAYFRIRKYCTIRKKTENKAILNAFCVLPILLTVLCPAVLSQDLQLEQKNPGTITETEPSTTETNASEEKTNVLTETKSISVTEDNTKPTKEAKAEKTTATTEGETVEETSDVSEVTEEEIVYENVTEQEQDTLVQEPQEQIQQEPVYQYRNGTYTASSYGYDGDITVTITIENDIITDISAYSQESDTWYFDTAYSSVRDRILSSQNAYVDAVSGATYSSNAIMSSTQKALDSARN